MKKLNPRHIQNRILELIELRVDFIATIDPASFSQDITNDLMRFNQAVSLMIKDEEMQKGQASKGLANLTTEELKERAAELLRGMD